MCPYAKVKSIFRKKVICELLGSEVNHKKYPCLSGNYERCPIYEEFKHREGAKETELIAPTGKEAESDEPLEKMVNEEVVKAKRFYDPKKGEEPPTCYDCLYFSPTTRYCLLLRKKVPNPEEPECRRSKAS